MIILPYTARNRWLTASASCSVTTSDCAAGVSFRPVSGLHRFSTPVAGLYLSGSGTHPGGGVTGMPGFNTAHVVLASTHERALRIVPLDALREHAVDVPDSPSDLER